MRKPEGWNREAILGDKDVLAWYQSNLLRSRLSAESDLRKIALLTHRIGTTPAGVALLAKRKPDDLARKLVMYASDLKRKGRLDTYTLKTFSGLKAWLRFRRVEFDLYPRLRAVQGISLRTETVPTQEQLGQILGALSTRGRAMALMMAHSGLRPGAIAHDGDGGLRLRNLPDLSLEGAEPIFTHIPFQITVPGELSKTSREYVTFGTAEEARAVLTYLAYRRSEGERLTPDSPLIAVRPHQSKNWRRGSGRTDGFVTTETLTFELRTGIRKIQPEGTRWRPYVFRSYCSSHLLSAENAGKITRDVREAILGHDLGVAGRYNLSKKLHPDQIEEMRAAYKRCEPFLSTTPMPEANEGGNRVLRALMVVKGMSADAAEKVDLGSMTDSEIQELFRKLGIGAAPSKRSERAFSVDDVPKMLAAGWEFVAPLNGSMAVLRSP